jgi:hypothetical protein
MSALPVDGFFKRPSRGTAMIGFVPSKDGYINPLFPLFGFFFVTICTCFTPKCCGSCCMAGLSLESKSRRKVHHGSGVWKPKTHAQCLHARTKCIGKKNHVFKTLVRLAHGFGVLERTKTAFKSKRRKSYVFKLLLERVNKRYTRPSHDLLLAFSQCINILRPC